LGQAIESALAQTYRDLEVIVLDDGSSDSTRQVAAKYGSSIHYIWQENRGLAAARNCAIEASSGEYIALLDADDWWEPNKLEEQLPKLDGDPQVGLVYSDLRVVYDDGTIVPSFLFSRPLAAEGYVFDRLIKSGFILPSTVLLRRTCLDEVGMFNEAMRSHEDIELWFRICQKWKVAVIRKPLVHRRQGSQNMTSDPRLRAEYIVELFERALTLPRLTPQQHREMIRRLGESYLERGYFYFTKGRMHECRKSMIQSLRCNCWNRRVWRCYALSLLPERTVNFMKNCREYMRNHGLPERKND
jgi:glycosyltransferase involved in cell wall biosynthesis